MNKLIVLSRKFFPNLDYYEKAISYPYLSPSKPFSFLNGQCLEGIHVSLKNRKPILSVGSNRSPFQLNNKFSLNENLCVTPATLYNSDVVFSASISAYGSVPATQWPVDGAKVKLNVLWLNEKQLKTMHLSEGIGIAYNFVELKKESVSIDDINYDGPIYGYISINGVYDFDNNTPARLSDLKCLNGISESKTEFQAINYIKNQFQPYEMSIRDWIRKIISDKSYRIRLISKMSKTSLIPKKPPWKIIKIRIKGNNIY